MVKQEIHIMNLQLTNLQQLCDAVMSIWMVQHLVGSDTKN